MSAHGDPEHYAGTPLAQGASHMHELFRCYLAVGFTEDQALRLLAHMAMIGRQDPDEP